MRGLPDSFSTVPIAGGEFALIELPSRYLLLIGKLIPHFFAFCTSCTDTVDRMT